MMKYPISRTRENQLTFSDAYVIQSSRTLLAFNTYLLHRTQILYCNRVQTTLFCHLNNCYNFPALSSPLLSNCLDQYLQTYLFSTKETPPPCQLKYLYDPDYFHAQRSMSILNSSPQEHLILWEILINFAIWSCKDCRYSASPSLSERSAWYSSFKDLLSISVSGACRIMHND